MQQRTVQRVKAVGQLFRSASALVIWTVAIMSALSVVGFNVAPLLASAGVAGVALGFGAQTLIKDFLAGIFIILEDIQILLILLVVMPQSLLLGS